MKNARSVALSMTAMIALMSAVLAQDEADDGQPQPSADKSRVGLHSAPYAHAATNSTQNTSATKSSIRGRRTSPGGFSAVSRTASHPWIYPAVIGDCVWIEQHLFRPLNGDAWSFGVSVSVDGSTCVVGSLGDIFNAIPPTTHVFCRDGSDWLLQARFSGWINVDAHSVAVSGTTIFEGYGSPYGGHMHWPGQVNVYERSGTTWTKTAELAIDPAPFDFHDEFGWSVDLDGDTALVGAPMCDVPPSYNHEGAAFVFNRAGTTWTQTAQLVASDPAPGGWLGFGHEVSLSGDSALVCGLGSGYVFTRVGTTWIQQAKLSSTDWFVSGSIDGNRLALGSPASDIAGQNAGAVFLYACAGSAWTVEATLVASDAADGDAFGGNVSLKGDTVIVGAQSNDLVNGSGANEGAAYVFSWNGTRWVEEAKLTASDAYAGDGLGVVDFDGSTVLVAAPSNDVVDGSGVSEGAAYTFSCQPRASTSFRNSGSNPASYAATTLPFLGGDYVASVDLAGTTGHAFVILAAYPAPLTFMLAGGQTGLVDPSGPEYLGFPTAAGPVASISIPIPPDPAYAGFQVYTQAAHVGGTQPFALSNAQDLILGH